MIDEVINLFDDGIKPYIEELLKGRIGVGAHAVEVCNVDTGVASFGTESAMRGDRFQLLVPYAGDRLVWNVIFDATNPEYPPDFGFDDSFLADPDVGVLEEAVPSLANWDGRDPKALLRVVGELLSLYRKFQISLLDDGDSERLNFEYSSLVYQTDVEETDVEVLVASRQSARTRQTNQSVHFLIRLNVDFSGLPPLNKTENAGESSAYLLVVFHPPQWSRILPQLILSPAVETALGNSSFSLPQFPQRDCLMDYVPIIKKQLKDKIEVVITSFEKREQFISILIFKLSGALLEYDFHSFTQASFLLMKKDFFFVLHVTLPQTFPNGGPVYLLQSVYHASHGKPFKLELEGCPYSPRWKVPEIVDRAISFIWDEVDKFQKVSVQSCSSI
ncbi:BRISC and BRCA1-A complex member 2-like [Bacillus rossius redtenbacheri]|uniref:BRISC and BRCA1-A complex member 2-like n=1 Tax=Bacillus rossius redtenbacheri TaxID=93214 RepID=UPI002FDE7BBB